MYFNKSITHFTYHQEMTHGNLVIDATPSYLHWPDVSKRISTTYGRGAKHHIIAILRDPVERAYAAWEHANKIASDESTPRDHWSVKLLGGNLTFSERLDQVCYLDRFA